MICMSSEMFSRHTPMSVRSTNLQVLFSLNKVTRKVSHWERRFFFWIEVVGVRWEIGLRVNRRLQQSSIYLLSYNLGLEL